jgi:hypothetical protein
MVLLSGIPAFAQQAPAVRTSQGFLANTLAPNDDLSTGQVNIGFTINFFGVSYSNLYVNNNGNVTFVNPLGEFTPSGLTESNIPIIAPFWADVDTEAPAPSIPVTYGRDTVNGRAAFGVNWVNVGYYRQHSNKLNSFQLVLIERFDTGPGNFDIEFNYNRISWETGDASDGENGLGGFSASAGYANGSKLPGTFLSIPGSLTPGSFLDSNPNGPNPNGLIRRTQNANGVLGRLVFAVRSGIPDPTISSISPNMIAAGSPQFQIQVNGAGFVSGSTVRWGNGTVFSSLVTTFQNAGLLQATVPANLVAAPLTAQVQVVNPAPAANPSASVPFTVTPLGPVVGGITPSSGAVGATVSATLSGSSLSGATAVTFSGSGVTATIGQGGTATSLPITITIAANAAQGIRTLTVTTGSGVSSPFSGFTVNPSGPVITGISQSSGAAGTTVSATLSGSNLTGATAVAFSGTGVTATILSGSGTPTSLEITITIAANAAPGLRTLTVTTSSVVSLPFSGFTVIPPLTISSISPNTIAAGSSAFQMQINGTGFINGATVRWVGGVPMIFILQTTFQSENVLQVTVPASLVATVYTAAVSVVNPGMQSGGSSNVPFTITPALPVVTGIEPASGIPGTTVSATVSGSNLAGATSVVFIGGSGIFATIGSGGTATSLPITITIAAGAPLGERAFTVTTPAGTSQPSGFLINQVQAPAITLTGLTPTPFPTQAATVGVNLSSAATSPLLGVLTLTFQPNASGLPAGYIDPATQFASGGRGVEFVVPVGASTVTLPQGGLVQQGTVAGTITVTLTALSSGGTNLLPANPPSRSIVVAGLPPVIYANSLQITNKSETAFNVEFNAYSTARDLTSVTFAFSPASGAVLNGTTSFTVPLDSIGPQWFGSPTGLSSGAAFHLATPFTISGDSSAIGSVSVTLTNSVGTSSPQSVGF